MQEFEWDSEKSRANIEKHDISFVLAAHFLRAGDYVIMPAKKGSEVRKLAIGPFDNGIITIVFTRRNGKIRIISARRASREEREDYRALQGQ